MKGYKGFGPDLVCHGKQYAENTVFEEDRAAICYSGMHFCQDPYEVLRYYPVVNDNGDFNEFAEVEALDEVKTDDGKKFCTKKLRVGEKLGLSGFVNACVDFLFEKAEHKELTDGSNLAASGNYSKLAASGDGSKLDCTGTDCVICCAGHGSAVRAKIGCWITLAEWKNNKPVCVKTEYVDGERIKEDVYYILKDGEFAEWQK